MDGYPRAAALEGPDRIDGLDLGHDRHTESRAQAIVDVLRRAGEHRVDRRGGDADGGRLELGGLDHRALIAVRGSATTRRTTKRPKEPRSLDAPINVNTDQIARCSWPLRARRTIRGGPWPHNQVIHEFPRKC